MGLFGILNNLIEFQKTLLFDEERWSFELQINQEEFAKSVKSEIEPLRLYERKTPFSYRSSKHTYLGYLENNSILVRLVSDKGGIKRYFAAYRAYQFEGRITSMGEASTLEGRYKLESTFSSLYLIWFNALVVIFVMLISTMIFSTIANSLESEWLSPFNPTNLAFIAIVCGIFIGSSIVGSRITNRLNQRYKLELKDFLASKANPHR